MKFPPLNAIIDCQSASSRGWAPLDLASACLDGGARFLQIRAKALGSGELLDLAAAIVERAAGSGAIIVVNDRADIAAMAHADGVHVGQEDLPPSLVRKVVGATAIVGLSTHTAEQMARAAREPISYLAVGPVFGSRTKDTGYDAVGLDRVREAASFGLPVVAIGGITLDKAADVIAAGATSVAVIGDLLAGGDPAARARAFVDRLAGATPTMTYNRDARRN